MTTMVQKNGREGKASSENSDEGNVRFFEGNFTDYEEWKKKTLGADAVQPHRIKYKKIAK